MRYILCFITFMLSTLSIAQEKVVSYIFISNYNSRQSSIKQYIGYETILIHPKKNSDMTLDIKTLIGERYYFYDDIYDNYIDTRTSINYKYNKNWSTNLNLSILSSNEWSPILFDGIIRYNNKKISIELYKERESVGTPITNNLKYISSFTGISIDYLLTKQFTISNGITHNSISDGNSRWYQNSRFIYTLNNDKSYFDIKLRHMYGSDWSRYYFSPNYINQYIIGYGLYKSFYYDKLNTKVYIGIGLQEIDKDYIKMFNFDIKESFKLKSKLNGDIIINIRSLDKYIYNTLTINIYYVF